MARLVYTAIASLDGYVEDATGSFEWAAPDEELHAFLNDLERAAGTYLYGRRMYETMAVWQTWDVSSEPPVVRDFAEIWRNADKVVYSTTLPAVSTPRTRLERSFDPGAVRALKLASTAPISIGGAELAGHAMRANLVDEYRLFLHPIIVGGGKPALPRLDGPLPLVLVEEKRFGSGVVYLRYDNLRQPR